MTQHRASGTFEVKLTPATDGPGAVGSGVGRMTIAQRFHGDLDGTSEGQMLAIHSAVPRARGGYRTRLAWPARSTRAPSRRTRVSVTYRVASNVVSPLRPACCVPPAIPRTTSEAVAGTTGVERAPRRGRHGP
jgi:hypothetical protein